MGLFDKITDPFGLDLFGTQAADDANKANEKRYQQALGIWNQLGGQHNILMNRAEGALGRQLDAIRSGFQGARSSLAGQGQATKSDILAREKQNLASTQQSLVSRGLYGSTTLDAANAGIYSDTNREMSAVDQAIAQMMAQLQVGQAGAEAQAHGGMAAFQQSRYSTLADLLGGKIGTIEGRQDVAAPSILSQLGPFAALAAFGG